ncbi:secondary thiamine-phosphate synthase enzyme YjbQ [Patescibacteria group bacterium]|nr:secondary thiamine-phosphate synthase enzyme YjbQ [Patescibacteria group bacterium]
MIDVKKISFLSDGNGAMVNLTKEVANMIRNGSIEDGIINVYSHGSTTGMVVMGGEDGLDEDFVAMIERLVPEGPFKHDEMTDPNNGVAHMRSALVGTGVNIPFNGKRLQLGMFQQIFFVDFDLVKREREIIVQVMGE